MVSIGFLVNGSQLLILVKVRRRLMSIRYQIDVVIESQAVFFGFVSSLS